jgi:hypothetical protein
MLNFRNSNTFAAATRSDGGSVYFETQVVEVEGKLALGCAAAAPKVSSSPDMLARGMGGGRSRGGCGGGVRGGCGGDLPLLNWRTGSDDDFGNARHKMTHTSIDSPDSGVLRVLRSACCLYTQLSVFTHLLPGFLKNRISGHF